MRLIDGDALMEYCLNQKTKTIDCNDIARFPLVNAVPGVCAQCPHWGYSSPCINGNEFYCSMLEKYTPADFYCKYGLEEPVIRCSECKWWNTEWKHEDGECYCYKIDQWTAPQFYCASGERSNHERHLHPD